MKHKIKDKQEISNSEIKIKGKEEQIQKKYHPDAHIVMGENILLIEGRKYEIIANEKNALDIEMLREKYDPFLNQYDYLVGDISSDHLRLKGFYDTKEHVAIDKKAITIVDYLDEYSNPGSPYFILHLLGDNQVKRVALGRKKKYRANNKIRRKNNFKERKVQKTKISHHSKVVKQKKNKGFVIKKRKG